jgi:hypothetical protein
MEAFFFTLKPLSMTTAQRSPPSAVARRAIIDRGFRVKHAPPCESMDHPRPLLEYIAGNGERAFDFS